MSSMSQKPSEERRTFAQALLDKKPWCVRFAIVSGISIVGLLFLGTWTYTSAPPIVDYVSTSGETVIPASSISRGKEVFHLKGLMSWGSFWGDGADRGPDFTAEALHRTVVSMKTYYENELKARQPEIAVTDQDAIAARVLREVRENTYDPAANRIVLNDAQVAAFEELNQHYTAVFTDPTSKDRFSDFVNGHISDPADLRALTGYFFWGGWASAANRPGETYSYTHNWPYDPDAGNYPTMPTLLWSFLSILALFAGAMLVLYVYGQL